MQFAAYVDSATVRHYVIGALRFERVFGRNHGSGADGLNQESTAAAKREITTFLLVLRAPALRTAPRAALPSISEIPIPRFLISFFPDSLSFSANKKAMRDHAWPNELLAPYGGITRIRFKGSPFPQSRNRTLSPWLPRSVVSE
jgi:hypothetical protein